MKGRPLGHYQKFIVNLSLASTKETYNLCRVTVHWGKGNNQTLWGLLDNGYEVTLIPGDPNVTVAH